MDKYKLKNFTVKINTSVFFISKLGVIIVRSTTEVEKQTYYSDEERYDDHNDDEDEDEELKGSDDDQQEDPQDYRKGKIFLFMYMCVLK